MSYLVWFWRILRQEVRSFRELFDSDLALDFEDDER